MRWSLDEEYGVFIKAYFNIADGNSDVFSVPIDKNSSQRAHC